MIARLRRENRIGRSLEAHNPREGQVQPPFGVSSSELSMALRRCIALPVQPRPPSAVCRACPVQRPPGGLLVPVLLASGAVHRPRGFESKYLLTADVIRVESDRA